MYPALREDRNGCSHRSLRPVLARSGHQAGAACRCQPSLPRLFCQFPNREVRFAVRFCLGPGRLKKLGLAALVEPFTQPFSGIQRDCGGGLGLCVALQCNLMEEAYLSGTSRLN